MPKVVFVHLGSAPVNHLWNNLRRHLELFPGQNPHVVVNNETNARIAAELGIPVTYFQSSESQEKLLLEMDHDSNFRKGFWRFTLERLFALEVFHSKYPNDSILHIESDVLLMPKFPFTELELINKLSWTKYNEWNDVSAILFSPSLQETSWLIRNIEDSISRDKKLTDMTVLAQVRRKNPYRIVPLPGVKEAFEKGFSNCYDSAVIGMWLCGEDPRNHYGVLKLHNNESFESGSTNIDPSRLRYRYSTNEGLTIQFESRQLFLNCLHIHSKEPKLFDENWESELTKYLELSTNPLPVTMFRPRILMNLFKQNLTQRTLIPFLLGTPPIYKARMRIRRRLNP